jgi:hypothetical protein
MTSTAAPPSEICEALPAVMVPSFSKAPRSLGERLGRRLAAHALVGVDHERVALALGHRDGDDLLGELARGDGRRGQLVAARRELVLALARDAAVVVALGREPHGALVEGARQAVEHHRVDDLLVADAVAGARAGQQVRRVGHRLHAARDDDVGLAGADHEVGQVDGLQPREADLVDGRGVDGHRDAALDGGLARGDLALAGLEDLAHQHEVDAGRVDAGAIEHALDGGAAQVLALRRRRRPTAFRWPFEFRRR